jgi:hypothetical protein
MQNTDFLVETKDRQSEGRLLLKEGCQDWCLCKGIIISDAGGILIAKW